MNPTILITHLIREELRNKRFMYSLEDLGFDCSAYTLDISRQIMELAGFTERTDELYQWYFELVDKALEEITFWNMDEMLTKWAGEIYYELEKRREKGKEVQ